MMLHAASVPATGDGGGGEGGGGDGGGEGDGDGSAAPQYVTKVATASWSHLLTPFIWR